MRGARTFATFVAAAFSVGAAAATPPAAGEPASWTGLVGASRAAVVKAVGAPKNEWIALLDEGAEPLQVVPMGEPSSFDEDGVIPKRSTVRVLDWPGAARGMDFQVVLKDDKVLWAVAPPLADEKDTAAVTKKYGAAIEAKGDVHIADTMRAWQVLAYPAKGLAFVHAPGESAIVARVVRKAP